MKKIMYLMLLLTLAVGCSKDDEEFLTEEPQQENPTEEDQEEEEEEEEEEDSQGYDLQPGETASFMVDPNATAETVALFYNLKKLSENKFVVGQQDAFAFHYNNAGGDSDMKKTTGSDPGLLGSDLMFITDDNNNGQASNWFYQQEQMIIEDCIEAYNKGMINAFTWHLREPYRGEDFYTADMTEFEKANAFKSILPGGANHEYYKQKLDKVAEVVSNIRGSDGTLSPVIFRPFHEFDGDFFWWGAPYNSPDEFITLWRFTVEYLRDDLGVHNMLFAYAPDNSYTTKPAYLQRYPGDDYVDILAMDNYGDLSAQDGSGVATANSKLKLVSDLAIEKVKISALSETGYFVTPSEGTFLASNFYSENIFKVATDGNIQLGFLMFWQNYEDTYTVPVPGVEGTTDFLAFANHEKTVLLDNLPDMYTLPN